jgi:DNA-binding NtrC family response regulator
MFAVRVLARLGVSAVGCGTCQEALKLVDLHQKLQMYLIDSFFPNHGAFAFWEAVSEGRQNCSAIFTGMGADLALFQLKQYDRRAQFLLKPFSVNEIRPMIAHIHPV